MRLKIINAGLFCMVVLSLISFGGCNLVKKTVNGKKAMNADENIVRKVVNAQPDWKFTEIRMTGRADDDDKKIGFMGTIKIEKDKRIYVVLRSTIGIEVARVYADRDSVWIVSRMLGIKEKGDWKLMTDKIGYPLDFFAMQGILVQSLFTSAGDQLDYLIENLVVKEDKEELRLISNAKFQESAKGIKYLNDFLLNTESFLIEDSKIRDIKGQWIADVKYSYNKDNAIRKIELKGIDSERNFAVDVNIIKKENKENIEFNFNKF